MKKKGISLIVLIVTIIIMIIIASLILVAISDTGIIDKARSATFKNDFSNIKDSFNINKGKLITDNLKDIIITEDNASEIKKYIPIFSEGKMENKKIGEKNYLDLIQIYNSELYQKENINDEEIERWLTEVGITKMPSEEVIYDNTQNKLYELIEDSNGKYKLTKYFGADLKNVKIPNVIIESGERKEISEIYRLTDKNGNNIIFEDTVTIPSDVTLNHVFTGNENLNIIIGNNCTIKRDSFVTGNYKVKSVIIGRNANIENGTFYNSKIDSIQINGTPKSIGNICFYGSNLTGKIEVDLDTIIGNNAFLYCNNISEIVIKDNVILTEGAFEGCKVKKIIIGDNVDVGKKALSNESQDVIINGKFKNIGENAFWHNTGLNGKTIYIKDGGNIGNYGLYGTYISGLVMGDNCSIGLDAIFACNLINGLVAGDNCTFKSSSLEGSNISEIRTGNSCIFETRGLGGCGETYDTKIIIGDNAVINTNVLGRKVCGMSKPILIEVGKNAKISNQAFTKYAWYNTLRKVEIGEGATVGEDIFSGYTGITNINVYWPNGNKPDTWSDNWLGTTLTPNIITNKYVVN